jgi:hypothetical protein
LSAKCRACAGTSPPCRREVTRDSVHARHGVLDEIFLALCRQRFFHELRVYVTA